MTWKNAPINFGFQVLEDADDFSKKVAGKLLQRVVVQTPVDTGQARGNWRVNVGSVDTSTTEATDRSGQGAISKGVVQFDVNTNSFGTFAQLSAIKVENLVKVEGGDTTAKFNKLGKVKGLAENPNANKQEQEISYSDDDIPFGDTNADDAW